jgi:citronellyl-CoA synthetase
MKSMQCSPENLHGMTINRYPMSQTTQQDLIGITDVVARLPKFASKVPNLLTGLKQAYLRTPNTPAGLGLAFEKAVKKNPNGFALKFEEQQFTYSELNARAMLLHS